MHRERAKSRSRSSAGGPAAQRCGTVYVAVLGVALIVALIAMAGMHLARVETDVLTGAEQVAHAELLSQSAVEFAIARIMADSSWRTTYTSGTETPSSSGLSLGIGNIKFQLIDADGSLSDDDRDIVTVRGIGRVGEATQVTTIELEPTGTPLTCLNVAVHAAGQVDNNGTLTTDRMVSSNDKIQASGGQIIGDAWSVGAVSGGGNVTGVRYQSMTPARTMPNSATLWDYYLANGTKINIASIPSQTINNAVISASSNPYGTVNPQGIYIIDTQGQTLHIRNSRIVATLVIISPSATTQIESLINWSPPAANFPSLLVQGNLSMQWSGGSPLVEATAGVSFNPTGTPYETSVDVDLLDSYPGVIKGLVYCSGNLTSSSACVMQGSLIAGGTATLSSTVTVAYGPAPASFPPPGFASGNVMRVVPRTWKRVAK